MRWQDYLGARGAVGAPPLRGRVVPSGAGRERPRNTPASGSRVRTWAMRRCCRRGEGVPDGIVVRTDGAQAGLDPGAPGAYGSTGGLRRWSSGTTKACCRAPRPEEHEPRRHGSTKGRQLRAGLLPFSVSLCPSGSRLSADPHNAPEPPISPPTSPASAPRRRPPPARRPASPAAPGRAPASPPPAPAPRWTRSPSASLHWPAPARPRCPPR